jgi:serine/threonine-protein kinase
VNGIPNRVTQLSVGRGSTCAIAGGWVYCWGDNEFGQLGTGDRFDKLTATPVATPQR